MTRRTARILEIVALAYDVDAPALRGKDRHKSLAHARQAAYYLLRHVSGLSFPEIGIEMQRDHTTVMSGIKALERRLQSDDYEAQRIAELMDTCRPRMPSVVRVSEERDWLQRMTPAAEGAAE